MAHRKHLQDVQVLYTESFHSGKLKGMVSKHNPEPQTLSNLSFSYKRWQVEVGSQSSFQIQEKK